MLSNNRNGATFSIARIIARFTLRGTRCRSENNFSPRTPKSRQERQESKVLPVSLWLAALPFVARLRNGAAHNTSLLPNVFLALLAVPWRLGEKPFVTPAGGHATLIMGRVRPKRPQRPPKTARRTQIMGVLAGTNGGIAPPRPRRISMIQPSGFIWEPPRDFIERTNVYRFINRLGLATYQDFIRYSQERLEEFWDELARELAVDWFEPYTQVLDASRGVEWARWFTGGKLNIAWNCLDRHADGPARDHPAVIWEGEDGSIRTLTFAELRCETDRLANALRRLDLVPGDRVALYMPMVPEVVMILYACFKLGLIAVPIFSGFGYAAVAVRLQDSGAKALFTADSLERRGRPIALKQKADEALAQGSAVRKVVVWRYHGGIAPWTAGRDVWWHDFVGQPEPNPEPGPALPLDSEAPCLLLYTSGTTGRPKGAVHTHAGALAADRQGDLPHLRPPAGRPLLVGLRHRLDDGPLGDYREPPLGGRHPALRWRARLSHGRALLADDRPPSRHHFWHFPDGHPAADAQGGHWSRCLRSRFAALAGVYRRALG